MQLLKSLRVYPPKFNPMPLARLPEPFDHPDFIFEVKYDGFRALAHLENGAVRLVSRNHNPFKTFPDLCSTMAACIEVEWPYWMARLCTSGAMAGRSSTA